MKYLKIQNNGELDIRLVALMGGTTKANDRFKIGQFGTGLKYTLAYLFRNNIDFKIFIGGQPVDVSTVTENIQGSDFEIICINGNRTSITAGMGHQWSAWMIIRELWCNALDEGSASRNIVTDTQLVGEEGATVFYIQVTPEIQEVVDNWRKYFIQENDPIWENAEYGIYHNNESENLCLYKNGVLIYQHPNTKSLFSYDIKRAEINEMREFKGMVSYEVLKALERPNNDVISYFLRNVKEDHFEGSELDYDWFAQFADIWRDSIGNDKIIGVGSYTEYERRGVDVDYSNVIVLPKKVYRALTKKFEGVGAIAISDDQLDFYEANFASLEDKVNGCLQTLAVAGYVINEGVRFKYGFFQEKTRLISANRSKNEVLISESAIAIDATDLCSLIVEHVEYLKLKVKKDTSEYRNHFINLYTRQLLNPTPITRTTSQRLSSNIQQP